MKLLLYCTKAKPILRDYRGKAIYNRFVISPTDRPFTSDDTQPILNGKIVIECDFEVEEIDCKKADKIDRFYKYSRLTYRMLDEYLKGNNGYAIHIKNLHIFDKPKYLDELWVFDKQGLPNKLYNTPTCMKKVEMIRFLNTTNYILIPVSPEEMCRIANGEQSVIVRKKILREMIK